MIITGKIYDIFDTEIINEKFQKRTFILATGHGTLERQLIPFTLTRHRVNMIEGFRHGEYVEVNFRIRGREWNPPGDEETKYFITLEARGVSSLEKTQSIFAKPVTH